MKQCQQISSNSLSVTKHEFHARNKEHFKASTLTSQTLPSRAKRQQQVFCSLLLGNLSKGNDKGKGNDDARKQWSDWLNEEK